LGKSYVESVVRWRPCLAWVCSWKGGAWLDCWLCCCDSEEEKQGKEKILRFHFLVFMSLFNVLKIWSFDCRVYRERAKRLKEKTFEFWLLTFNLWLCLCLCWLWLIGISLSEILIAEKLLTGLSGLFLVLKPAVTDRVSLTLKCVFL